MKAKSLSLSGGSRLFAAPHEGFGAFTDTIPFLAEFLRLIRADAVVINRVGDVDDEQAEFADEGVGRFVEVAVLGFALDWSELAAGAPGEPVDDAGVAGQIDEQGGTVEWVGLAAAFFSWLAPFIKHRGRDAERLGNLAMLTELSVFAVAPLAGFEQGVL